jgi:hypothetical protein
MMVIVYYAFSWCGHKDKILISSNGKHLIESKRVIAIFKTAALMPLMYLVNIVFSVYLVVFLHFYVKQSLNFQVDSSKAVIKLGGCFDDIINAEIEELTQHSQNSFFIQPSSLISNLDLIMWVIIGISLANFAQLLYFVLSHKACKLISKFK